MISRIALLLGLLVVPLLALKLGNRFRDQGARHRRIFWGAVLGHTLGMAMTMVAALLPPIVWQEGTFLRTVLVFWSMLLGGAAGALLGGLTAGRSAPVARPTRPQ